jgi:ATP-binding cassette, subfamily B, bacterial PglK
VISQEKSSFYGVWKSLYRFLPFKLKIRFMVLIFLMAFSAFAEIVSIGLVIPFLSAITSPDVIFNQSYLQPALNFFSIESNAALIKFLTAIFCMAAIFSAGLRLLTLWVQTRFCYSIGADLSAQIYKNSLYQSYSVHVSRNSSEYISTIVAKTTASTSFAILPVLNILSSGFVLLAVTITLIAIQPFVALSALFVFGSLYGLVILVTRNKLDVDSKKISHEQDQVIKILQEGFGSIRDILVSNTQEVYLRSYRTSFSSLQKAWANVEIIKGTPRYVIEALGIIAIALLALHFSTQPNGMVSAIPILGAMALGAQRILPILQLIYSSLSSLRAGFSSLLDVIIMLEEPTNEVLTKAENSLVEFNHQITLQNLQFKYSDDGPWILDGINLSIPKGGILGIIGSTGSGKSTLTDILMGLLHPNAGSFFVDDIIITESNKFGWQSTLAHVPQSIFLTDSSIAENIALGVPPDEIDFDLVQRSAEQAQIHETISAWSNKYNTIVGERGVRISGGQRQRIGIARALYKKAPVIIFDEATSALDSSTEASVMQSIASLDQDLTIIIVAHRLTTLKNCSNIIELSNGKILRQGVYNDII